MMNLKHFPTSLPSQFVNNSPLGNNWKPAVDEVGHPTSVNARILELRKEKSRDAARSRRGKENFEFYELAKMLPLPAAITSQLDKASIIRLTISYLKLRDFSGHGDPPWSRDGPAPAKSKASPVRSRSIAMEMFEQHQGTHILQSLDGFAFALAADGRFLYISETVSIYLGLSQVEMTGSSVFDYVHHQDHAEMAEQLGLGLAQGGVASPSSQASDDGASTAATNNPDVSSVMALSSTMPYKGLDRAFCIRMKSTLTKRGCHFKSSGYRVVLVLCRLRPQYTFSHSRKASPPLLGMVAIAMALPPPSVHEIRLESDMFVTRINFDFRIVHCEPKVSDLLDFTPEEMTGKNLYALCHGEDAHKLRKSHLDLINKGQVMTQYYRVMNKSGGYTWMQTCATVVCNSKNADEQNIICVNYVISGREYEHLIMDCCQLEESSQSVKREEPLLGGGNDPENGSPDGDRGGAPPTSSQSTGRTTRPAAVQSQPPPQGTAGNGGGATSSATGNGGADLEEESSGTEPHRARHHQHHLQNQALRSMKQRRALKRKLPDDESSCCSSDEEEEDDDDESVGQLKSAAVVLSPASSCQNPSPKATPHHEDSDGGGPSNPGGGTVKDLEHAMSKHLPAKGQTPPPPLHQPTDFSADALLKQQQRTTIQWIGAHHHLNQSTASSAPSSAPLPASALLRQLYANRESVIRANVHAAAAAAAGGGRTSGPPPSGYYPAPEQLGPLPTPPGSEGSGYGDHQFVTNLYSSNGPGGYAVDYHSAMTPPSSVSPRDKHAQLHAAAAAGPTSYDSGGYTDVLRHQYSAGGTTGAGGTGVGASTGNEIPAQPLPLKPQVYSAVHPGTLDAYSSAAAAAAAAESQFYHHAASFHLYHPTANKAAANWYSTAS